MIQTHSLRLARNFAFLTLVVVVVVARADLRATRGCSQFVCSDGAGFRGHFCSADDIDGFNNTCLNFRELCQQYCAPHNTSPSDPNSGIVSFDCNTSTHLAACFCKDKATCELPPQDCPDECSSEPDCGSYEFCSNEGPTDYCRYPASGCEPGEQAQGTCCVLLGSPVVIDLAGDGFDLTSLSNGVLFAIGPATMPYRVSWTAPASDDAWLVLDRDGNGRIDNGLELFGNFTEQSVPQDGEVENGFLALAEFDKRSKGGNRDGQISADDRIFKSLRLWRDRNHDGLSTSDELVKLDAAGVRALHLDYKLGTRTDTFGNGFRFRARVETSRGPHHGTWAVDVMLATSRAR